MSDRFWSARTLDRWGWLTAACALVLAAWAAAIALLIAGGGIH